MYCICISIYPSINLSVCLCTSYTHTTCLHIHTHTYTCIYTSICLYIYTHTLPFFIVHITYFSLEHRRLQVVEYDRVMVLQKEGCRVSVPHSFLGPSASLPWACRLPGLGWGVSHHRSRGGQRIHEVISSPDWSVLFLLRTLREVTYTGVTSRHCSNLRHVQELAVFSLPFRKTSSSQTHAGRCRRAMRDCPPTSTRQLLKLLFILLSCVSFV